MFSFFLVFICLKLFKCDWLVTATQYLLKLFGTEQSIFVFRYSLGELSCGRSNKNWTVLCSNANCKQGFAWGWNYSFADEANNLLPDQNILLSPFSIDISYVGSSDGLHPSVKRTVQFIGLIENSYELGHWWTWLKNDTAVTIVDNRRWTQNLSITCFCLMLYNKSHR